MADRTVVTDLLARDRMSDVFDKAGRNATRFGGIVGKAGKLAGAGLAAGALVGAAGLAAVGGWLVQGVKDAASYQKVMAKTAQVLKSTGNTAGTSVKGIAALAAELESLSGVDEELIINSQNVLATFTKVRNETGRGNKIFTQATKAALDMSVALGTDLQGATIQIGKALNDPIKGITALSRVGVSFTQQQKDQIKTLVETGRTMDAQKLILRELNTEFGGQAKAAGATFEGSMARAKDAISDAGREVGIALLPHLTDAADWLAKKIPTAVEDFKQGWNGVGDGSSGLEDMGAAVRDLSGDLKDLGTWASSPEGGQAIADTFKTVGSGIRGAVTWGQAFMIGLDRIGAYVDVFSTGVALRFQRMYQAIVDGGARIPGPFGQHFRDMQGEVHAATARMQGDFDAANTRKAQADVDALDLKIKRLKGKKVKTEADKAELARSIAQVRELTRANNLLRSKSITITTTHISQEVVRGSSRLASGVRRGGLATGGWVSGPGSGTSDSVEARLSNGEFVVKEKQARKHGPMLEALNDGRQGFADGGWVGYASGGKVTRRLARGDLGDALGNSVVREIIKAAPKMSKAMERLGKTLASKLERALDKVKELKAERKQYQNSLRDSIIGQNSITGVQLNDRGRISTNSLLQQMQQQAGAAGAFSSRLRRLRAAGLNKTQLDQIAQDQDSGSEIARALLAGGKSAIAQANKLNASIRGSATKAGTSIGNEMYENGLASARGMVEGLKAGRKQLREVAGDMGKDVAKAVKKALGIKSPSKVFREEVGKQTVLGWAEGIARYRPVLDKQAAAAARATVASGAAPVRRVGRPKVSVGTAGGTNLYLTVQVTQPLATPRAVGDAVVGAINSRLPGQAKIDPRQIGTR